ncbi:MAG: hypothetical protein O9301_01650 [Leptospira sp.]|nr:hypothetical protein [Leptospira sp.]
MDKISLIFKYFYFLAFINLSSLSSQRVVEIESRPDGGFTNKIAGTWNCGDYGTLILSQDGSKVSGIYDFNGGTLSGIIVNNRIVGTWSESKSNDSGSFEFEIQILRKSPDPTNLKGKYNQKKNRNWRTGWDCVKE